jgi:molybdate transport system substrate-binding protein
LADEIRLLSTTALKSSLDEIVPLFERNATCKALINFTPSAQISLRIAEDPITDVAIATAETIAELLALGKIVKGSDFALARSQIGVAVQQDAATPDITSAEKFRELMLRARSIATSNPVGGGQSGRYLVEIFEKLGIAEAVKSKTIYGKGGPAGLIGFLVQSGEAEVGLQQMAELQSVPGIHVVGPLPKEIQRETVFSAGLSSAAANPRTGQTFLRFLESETAAAMINSKGLQAPV